MTKCFQVYFGTTGLVAFFRSGITIALVKTVESLRKVEIARLNLFRDLLLASLLFVDLFLVLYDVVWRIRRRNHRGRFGVLRRIDPQLVGEFRLGERIRISVIRFGSFGRLSYPPKFAVSLRTRTHSRRRR